MDNIESTKIDQRVIKSKQIIENTFLELLKEIEHSKVSILMVAEKAGVSRGTIYKHYNDKEGLLNATLQRGADSILQKLELYHVYDFPTHMTLEEYYHKLSNFPPDYQRYSNLKVNSDLFIKVQHLFCDQAEELLIKRYFSRFSLAEKSKKILAHHMAYSLFGILTSLEQQNTNEESKK